MYKQWYIFLDLTITLPEILKLDCHLENMALKSIKVIHTFIFLLSVQGLLGTKKISYLRCFPQQIFHVSDHLPPTAIL